MGFYGDIVNIQASTTQYQFDKIYPSRYMMEELTLVDGVFVGRYALIDYGTSLFDLLPKVTKTIADDGTELFSFDNGELVSELTTPLKKYFYCLIDPEGETIYSNAVFYQCIGYVENYAGVPAVLTEDNRLQRFNRTMVDEGIFGPLDPRTYNYLFDTKGAGYYENYDTSFWQKVCIGEVEKYVMLGRLKAEPLQMQFVKVAPEVNGLPTSPAMDKIGDNIYRFYASPALGARIKPASTGELSDAIGNYKVYNENNEIIEKVDQPLAFYYNKAGFSKDIRNYDDAQENYIRFEQTGESGYKDYTIISSYQALNEIGTVDANSLEEKRTLIKNIIDGLPASASSAANLILGDNWGIASVEEVNEKLPQIIASININGLENVKDTMEFSMSLPALGNMASETWDFVYGVDRNTTSVMDTNGELIGQFNDLGGSFERDTASGNLNLYNAGQLINYCSDYSSLLGAINKYRLEAENFRQLSGADLVGVGERTENLAARLGYSFSNGGTLVPLNSEYATTLSLIELVVHLSNRLKRAEGFLSAHNFMIYKQEDEELGPLNFEVNIAEDGKIFGED